MACRICAGTGKSSFVAREMMFGFRDEFDYESCSSCGSVQIKIIPSSETLSKYYPSDFWASKPADSERCTLKSFAYRLLGLLLQDHWKFVASQVRVMLPKTAFAQASKYGIRLSDKVLDVGCGYGNIVHALAKLGLVRPLGVDPFIDNDITYKSGAQVIRTSIEALDRGDFDVIMFHHSLEHVANPKQCLQHASQRLRSGGICIVRLPTSTSEAFEQYRENWVQLDPPRHLHVPSREGIRIMAQHSGMLLEKVVDDSSAFQFWGSEQYRRDIPLRDRRSYFVNRNGGLFSADTIASYEDRAKKLNAQNRGDQAIFFMRKL